MQVSSDDVVIVSGLRTPFGKFGGILKEYPTIDLGVAVIKETLHKNGLEGKEIDEVVVGHCTQCELKALAPVVARQVLLKAGLPSEVVSTTVERACCSSMNALQIAHRNILSGNADVVLVVGMENMSRIPFVFRDLRWGTRVGNALLSDDLFGMLPGLDYPPVALDVGEVALEYDIDRESQDRWAYNSQMKYQKALREGKFKDEIMPLEIKVKKKGVVVFDQDEFPRADVTMESLGKLPTVYGSKTVTAGNAPGLDAGAAALLVMRRSRAESMGLKPLARVLHVQSVATDAKYMASEPGLAIMKALQRTKLSVNDIKLIEINEAFAAVPMISLKIMADGDDAKFKDLSEITNVNGGAVAIGHPVGTSGARIVMTLMHELRRRGGGIGAAGICGGLGQADATILDAE